MTDNTDYSEVNLTQPYVWSVAKRAWINSGCSGCEYHVPDPAPEVTATIAKLARLGF